MSRETTEWLNQNTLIGFTDSDGNAWHWDGIADNQYPGAIPVEDIRRRLFDWKVEFRTPLFDFDELNPDAPPALYQDDHMKALVRIQDANLLGQERNIQVFNYVTDTYAIHQYDDWLLNNVAALVDESCGELDFGSAVLLKGGAIAAVQIRPPEMVTIGGDQMLRFILAISSHDSTIATTYKVVYQRVVCDNTLDMAMGEAGGIFRVKHLKNSSLQIAEAREALDIMFTGMGEFDAEIEKLMNTPLSTNQFAGAIKEMWPQPVADVVEENGAATVKNQRSINNWEARFDQMFTMWDTDPRVGDYKGTKWGGLMAYNTFNQWGMAERDTNDRDAADVKHSQLMGQVTGNLANDDRSFIRAMELVTA